jgi:hypothetical protein
MKLKEKFEQYAKEEIWRTRNYNAEECELIAEEFAIGFAEWFTNEQSPYSIMYGNQEKRFSDFRKEYTAKELLQIYKTEKGL